MNMPPGPPDPNALTQPIPIVPPPAPPPRPGKKMKNVPPPPGARPPSPHRFGNIPLYLLARFGAFAIDILGVAFVLTAFGFNAYMHGVSAFAARTETGFIGLAAGSFGVALLVACLSEALTGTTIGKLTFSLHTRRIDGAHAGGLRVLVRYLFLPLDLVLLGPILALVPPRHQRLGDLLAGTIVSGSRLRWFAPVIGIVFVGLIAFAQIAYGGSLTSAIETLAETANVVPGMITRTAQSLGLGVVHVPPIPVPALPSSLPLAQSPEPSAPPTSVPSAEATTNVTAEPASNATPSASEAPVATDAPTAAATDAPTAAASEPATSASDAPAPAITEPSSGTPDPDETPSPESGPSGVY